MKRKLSYLLSALVIASSFALPVTVMAHGNEDHTTSSSSSSQSNEDDTAHTENETKDRAERLKKFKASFKVKLNAFETAVIKQKCVAAQDIVGKLNTKFGNSVTVRTKAYDNLSKRLDKLVTKLEAKDIDTTTIEQQVKELKTRIATYNTDLTAYKQSLSDLKDVGCKADPDAFQAALLAARSARQTLGKDVFAIRSYLVSTIKPTLQIIKQQLESKADSSSSNSNSGSNQ